ncbi:MAG: glycosyltransferase [Alphaproteobacteria bacterium]|nr:glycosyltransferase [Alphaproteobacteria bacterium]
MRVIIAVVLLVSLLHAGLWGLLRGQQEAADVKGLLPSISYTSRTSEPRSKSDVDTDMPVAEKKEMIRADMKALSSVTRQIRLYSSTGGDELVPEIANEFGLKVMLGAWVDGAEAVDNGLQKLPSGKYVSERTELEIAKVIELAKRNSNVVGVVVGNETLFRGDQTVDDLIELIKRVKSQVTVPVTTGEIFSQWQINPSKDYVKSLRENFRKKDDRYKNLALPELDKAIRNLYTDERLRLASSVDFIAPHILPYHNNQPAAEAVDYAMNVYQELRKEYPGKRIMVAEFGWPSAGYNFGAAFPGTFEQATVLRNFVSRAEAIGMEYNIIEGIDRAWKARLEGGVGPYWGVLNAAREAKFPWTGPVVSPGYWKIAGIALVVGLLLSLPILRITRPTAPQTFLLAAAANAVGAWAATIFDYWNGHYFVWGSAFALTLGMILLVPLTLIAMARIAEIAAVAFGHKPRRLLTRAAALATTERTYLPKVSIHVPAYFEPVDMLKQTLDALARLDYPNYECVIIINNTPDPAFWQPIQDHCRALGERFKFINAEKVQGFKAGALRIAMERTAADAEIIGIIDADYVVDPDWLKDLVPAFADPHVGLVQAPQEHRDGDTSIMHYIMNGEYAGFFDIGMVQRNEIDAIIVHGTMCLIRRAAMDDAGGWSSDTICEDSDLGLAIQELGWTTHYTNHRYGHGMLPDTFEAFRKQRHRWAYGGVQIVKKHWRRFLPNASRLTFEQRREYSLGWLNWLGAESLGVVVALLNLIWVPIVVFAGIAIPDRILTLPIIASFVVALVHFLSMYRLRVRVNIGQMLGAMIAAMSVQWTVSRAVAQGFITEHLAFARTSKGGLSRMSIEFQAFWEAVIGTLLLAGAGLLIARNPLHITELYIFAAVLVLQSLPFLAAVAIAILELSRINSFDFWRESAIRAAELIGLRPVTLPLPGIPYRPTRKISQEAS